MAFDADVAVEGLNEQLENQRKIEQQNEKLINNLVEMEAKQKKNMLLAQQFLQGQKPKGQVPLPEAQPQQQATTIGPGGRPITGAMGGGEQEALDIDPFDISEGELVPSLTASGGISFKRKGVKQQIFENIQDLKSQGLTVSDKEQKFVDDFLGISDDTLRAELKKVEAGKSTFEKVRKRFPDQAAAIRKAQRGGLSNRSRFVLSQIETSAKEVAKLEGQNIAEEGETPELEVKELLKQLLDREDEASAVGIEIDDIMDILGFTRKEIEAFEQ